jgi:hypothetical protein
VSPAADANQNQGRWTEVVHGVPQIAISRNVRIK